MAKAILEFNLDDLDDKMAHLRAIKSLNMACALHEIVHNTKKRLKNKVEHENTGSTNAYEAIDIVFDKINEILLDNGVEVDDLIF